MPGLKSSDTDIIIWHFRSAEDGPSAAIPQEETRAWGVGGSHKL